MSYYEKSLCDAIQQGELLPLAPTECRGKWVAESLEEKIKEWVPDASQRTTYPFPEPILIHAPTGTGKTTFVIDYLSEFAKRRNQKVLIFSNRLALNMQFKQILNKKCGYNYGTKALEGMFSFENITVCTYQSAISFFNSFVDVAPLFVVCDEAHFFCSDATINAWTETILLSIIATFPYSHRIYMSATPENVKPIISAAEFVVWRSWHKNTGNYDWWKYEKREVIEYKFRPKFEHISLSFFNDWETITDLISDLSNLSKWLIFVSNREKGKELQKKLTDSEADYVDSSSKNTDSKMLEDLARRQWFAKKVLICTNVLDNGISFRDDKLKELVIDSTDFTEIVQMIGRKRMDEDEKVRVHVKIPELKTISTYLTTNENLLEVLQDFNRNRLEFIYKRWGHLDEGQQKLFWLRPYGDMVILGSNSIAQYQLGKRCGALERLKDEMTIDSDAFAKQICKLFGKEFLESMYEDGKRTDEVVRELTVILEEYLDKNIGAGEEMKQLDEKLQDYLARNPIPSKNLKFKKDKSDRSAEHIKQIIEAFSLPFTLSDKTNKTYRLLPKDEKEAT